MNIKCHSETGRVKIIPASFKREIKLWIIKYYVKTSKTPIDFGEGR